MNYSLIQGQNTISITRKIVTGSGIKHKSRFPGWKHLLQQVVGVISLADTFPCKHHFRFHIVARKKKKKKAYQATRSDAAFDSVIKPRFLSGIMSNESGCFQLFILPLEYFNKVKFTNVINFRGGKNKTMHFYFAVTAVGGIQHLAGESRFVNALDIFLAHKFLCIAAFLMRMSHILLVGYKSQVRSDPPIIFLPIINFIFLIISKQWFKCPVYQFYTFIHCLINIRQKIFLFSMILDLILKQFSVFYGYKSQVQ